MQRQINIKISEEEYKEISDNASILNKTTTAYVKELALSQNIINYNFDEIQKHTEEITEIKKILSQILYSILRNREIYKGDIQTILQLLQSISQSENELKATIRKDRNSKREYIKKCVNSNFQKLIPEVIEW